MCEYNWKYDNIGFAMEKRPCFFLFFKMANTQHKGKTRHIARLSGFLFKVQCFYRDENDLAPDDKYYIRGKGALCVLETFLRTITLFLIYQRFKLKVKFCTHLLYGYPDCFSYLILIALYTNSTYIIWLKKYSVFYFQNF